MSATISLSMSRRSVLAGSAFTLLGLVAAQPNIAATLHDELDQKQLGQIAFISRLAGQLPSDWSYMGSEEPGQGGFDAYRYQLAMMSYALAAAHHHYTPAWRDGHRQTSRNLIEKMLGFDVWSYWELTSRGAKVTDPDLTVLGAGAIDPVAYQNIMYSGHLFQMIATHQMLYNSREFDKPRSVSFVYDPVARGLGSQTFAYDIHKLAKVLLDQFIGNGWLGIECEPNAIFPECNQHPLIGLSLYDRLYGTDHFADTSRRFLGRFEERGYVGENSSYMSFLMLRQNRIIRLDDAWGDGWTGTFLHAWNREIAKRAYAGQAPRVIRRLADGTATIAMPDRRHGYSHGHGFMACAAAEIGDLATRDALLAYADKYWSPAWNDDALFYPRCDEYKLPGDGGDVWRRLQPLTANGLIALARLGGPSRLFNLVSNPFDEGHFGDPCLEGIGDPGIQVPFARYDRNRKVLGFGFSRSQSRTEAKPFRFRLSNLDRARGFELLADGVSIATGRPGGSAWAVSGTTVNWGETSVEVLTDVKLPARFELRV